MAGLLIVIFFILIPDPMTNRPRKKSKTNTRKSKKSVGKTSSAKIVSSSAAPAKRKSAKQIKSKNLDSPSEELQTATATATLIADKNIESLQLEQKSLACDTDFDSGKIMEQLAFLIALHDDQQNSFGQDDKLLGLWNQRFDLQNERLENIAFSIEKQKNEDPVDELFELFHERFDDLEQRIVTGQPGTEGSSHDTSELAELLKQNNRRFEALESRLDDIATQLKSGNNQDSASEDSVGQLFDLYNSHFEAQQTKLEQLNVSLECQSSSDAVPNNLIETLNNRFESVSTGLEKLTSILHGQQQLLESQAKQINVLSNGSTGGAPDSVDTNLDTEAPEEGEEAASHWHRQKEAMLSKYGIDPQHRPSMELPSTAPAESETTESAPTVELEISSEKMDPKDAKAIANLKEQLNDKLREAEIELSIKRAKLSQFNAELDEKRVELDRRESALQSHRNFPRSETPQKAPGLLERLKQYLTAKDRKNLDRI